MHTYILHTYIHTYIHVHVHVMSYFSNFLTFRYRCLTSANTAMHFLPPPKIIAEALPLKPDRGVCLCVCVVGGRLATDLVVVLIR